MSVYYIASLKINYFIAQNLGNKAKPHESTLGTRLKIELQIGKYLVKFLMLYHKLSQNLLSLLVEIVPI